MNSYAHVGTYELNSSPSSTPLQSIMPEFDVVVIAEFRQWRLRTHLPFPELGWKDL